MNLTARISTIFPVGLLLCATVLGGAGAAELHVASDGKDAHPGTKARPFARLERARDAIRELKTAGGLPPGGVTVWIRGGLYWRTRTFQLTKDDSGTAEAPIVYRACKNEQVRLSGGKQVTGFKPVTEKAAIERLDPRARRNVLQADLKAQGIADYGEFPVRFRGAPPVPELFFNDRRMTLARWPNGGWATTGKIVDPGSVPRVGDKSNRPGTFEYQGDRPSRWTAAEGVWLHGYWCFDWYSETIKVKAIDPEKRRITFAEPHHYGLGRWHGRDRGPRRYHAINLLEELDQPREYYLDRTAGRLYFWPPAPVEKARVLVSTLVEPMVSLEDASHITVRGLTLEICRGTGITVQGGRENQIVACRVRNTGQDAIAVSGGEKHRVLACDIHDTGTAGLRLSGGDRRTLAPAGHEAINNHIYRVSRRQRTHAYAIHLGGVGNRLAHNLLHHAPHQAIGLGGNDHVIELNEIHHVGMETDDCGAFYMGRNPSERGNILRHNFWHHTGSKLTHGSCAAYFDDGSGGSTVFGNVFFRCAGGNFGAVFCHGGHDNLIDNNVFVECKRAISASPWNDTRWKNYVKAPLWQTRLLKEVDVTKPPYVTRYPELEGFMEPSGKPRMNRAVRNVAVKCGTFIRGNYTTHGNLVTNDDPGFVDARGLNFQLKDDSIVYKQVPGFKRIPFGQIGLVKDEYRTALPPKPVAGNGAGSE